MAQTSTKPSSSSLVHFSSTNPDGECEEEYEEYEDVYEDDDEGYQAPKIDDDCSKSESDSSFDEEEAESEEGFSDGSDLELKEKANALLSNTISKTESRRSSFVPSIPKDAIKKEQPESLPPLSARKKSPRPENIEPKISPKKITEVINNPIVQEPKLQTLIPKSSEPIGTAPQGNENKAPGFPVKRLSLDKTKNIKHYASTHRIKSKSIEPKKTNTPNALISPRYDLNQSQPTISKVTKWKPAINVCPTLRKSQSQTAIQAKPNSPVFEDPKAQSYISLADNLKLKKRLNRRGFAKFSFEDSKSNPSPVLAKSDPPLSSEENLHRGLCERDTSLLNNLFSMWGIPPLSGNCQGKFLALLQQMTIDEEMRTGGLVTPPSVVDLSCINDQLFIPEPGYQIDLVSTTLTSQITFKLDQNYYRQQFFGQPQWIYAAYENRKIPLLFCTIKTVDGNSLKTFKASSKGFEIISIPVSHPSKVKSRNVTEWISKTFDCHPLKVKDSRIQPHIANFEENDPQKLHTVTIGVVNVMEGQTDENAIFSNTEISPANQEFLHYLGETITLKGWNDFTGGLDVKANTKGTHSIFTHWRGIKIMYHVAALLPYSAKDAQQIERKNMIGNDIVVVVFKEGSQPFLPSTIRSHMNHIIVVVTPEKHPVTGTVSRYRLSCARKDSVPEFGPDIPMYVEKGPAFREMLLAKIMNGMRNARNSRSFSRLYSLPRAEGLTGIIDQYVSGSKTKNFLFRTSSDMSKSSTRIA